MNIGDLVTIKGHTEHVGVITDLSGYPCAWITIKWFNNDIVFSEFQIPLSSAKHIEVLQ